MVETVRSLERARRSAVNSLFQPLGMNETFTGRWEVNDWSHAAVNILTDQEGTLFIDVGIVDPITNEVTLTFTTPTDGQAIRGGQAYFQSLVKGPGRALRVRYVNADTAQTEMYLQTIYSDALFPSNESSASATQVGTVETNRDVSAFLQEEDIDATVYGILIDLSDTINFPHDLRGRVDLTNTFITVDRTDNNAQGSVRVGVITRVDGTDADITYVQGVTFNRNADRFIVRDRKFSPTQLKLGVDGVTNSTLQVISNLTESNVTAVNTGTLLNSPRGPATVAPGLGDVIVRFEHQSGGDYDARVGATYHTESSPDDGL